MIRAATAADATAIAAIYNHYIKNTTITFEETPVAPADIAQRIATVTADYPWLVLERDTRIVGYAYASRFHARSAYRFTVETTVYVASDAHRAGIGAELYADLLARLPRGLRSWPRLRRFWWPGRRSQSRCPPRWRGLRSGAGAGAGSGWTCGAGRNHANNRLSTSVSASAGSSAEAWPSNAAQPGSSSVNR